MIKLLLKKSNYTSVLKSFYKFSDLDLSETIYENFYDISILTQGLEFLFEIQESPSRAFDFINIVGQRDSLLDSAEIKNQLPNTRIINNAGHAPQNLMKVLSKILK